MVGKGEICTIVDVGMSDAYHIERHHLAGTYVKVTSTPSKARDGGSFVTCYVTPLNPSFNKHPFNRDSPVAFNSISLRRCDDLEAIKRERAGLSRLSNDPYYKKLPKKPYYEEVGKYSAPIPEGNTGKLFGQSYQSKGKNRYKTPLKDNNKKDVNMW